MSDHLAQLLDREAASLSFARSAFPLWVQTGFADHRHTLHSVGVSYWACLGHHLAWMPMEGKPANKRPAQTGSQPASTC